MRVSQAVGVPISAFIADSNSGLSKSLMEARADHMIALVKCYMNDASDYERDKFISFLKLLTDAEAL
ncbi:hypothetical protein [Methylobacterium sp. E-045]|uniref:hypothetical protein n=1 Tax=Methylobacterium sp. E-045 TaxID=2836575 RepID=UPI001FB9A5EF|nr:hypothetical protein [Methylobacterium sp. E-045]MCJ2127859.1 hypothetical protein [Methylobacterium sp. E-045]